MSVLFKVDELYVISDLHLGGEIGFQIFGSTPALTWFVDTLTAASKRKEVALLINGDFVDFLAESDPVYFDVHGATNRLDRIFLKDKSFRPILCALREFAATPNRKLVINLGNHDLEIGLPWVGEHLVELIANGHDAARGRIHILTEGTGASFQIASTKIYCAHGNEVDSWNVTDHEKIRKIGRDVLQGRGYEGWIPNAGTQLVIEAMNEIKKRFPFVDLLKPETEAVIPILVALKPSLAKKITNAPRVLARRARDMTRLATGFLGDDPLHDPDSMPQTSPLGEAILRSRTRNLAKKLLEDVDDRYKQNQAPMDMLSSDQQGGFLGTWGAIWAAAKGEHVSEVLREKLDVLENDTSFDIAHKDETYIEFDKRIGPDFDIIATGHTHLERAIERDSASGYYYNTGTWTRLIEITKTRLRNENDFREMFDAIQAGTMADLEKVPGLIKQNNTVLCVKRENRQVVSELARVSKVGRSFQLVPVPGTEFISR